MRNKLLICLLALTIQVGLAQTIATFEVDQSKLHIGLDQPISISIEDITFHPARELALFEVLGNKKNPVPFQIEESRSRKLHWMIAPDQANSKMRIYELVKKAGDDIIPLVQTEVNDGVLTIESADKKLLDYHFKTVYPPPGIDTAFRRSAFIHPLRTPNGQSLTRIQPPDHYHHYGLWNPWTHVLFEGDTVDFWNLKSGKGTVRFANFVSRTNGPVYSEFKALHEHVAFKKDGSEKVALNELQTVRVYRLEKEQNYYFVDITIEMNCAGESPFHILEYRYAGLGWRATELWNKGNSEVLTSEGQSRKGADGTTARWCILQGALGNDHGGAVMMSHPTNYNHPEPLRIWPEDSNNGEVFAMFAPTKTKDWLLEPGRTYTLRYRFVVFNGRFTGEQAEEAWKNFAGQLVVKVKR